MSEDMQLRFMRVQNGNDVRGAAIATEKEPVTLTPEIVEKIAASFAEYLEQKTGKRGHALRIGVGHDSRVTAEIMKEACFRGLIDVECYDCGLITTPAMFQSVMLPASDFDGAIMLTASHLPFNRNGMKFFTKDGAMAKKELTGILARAAELAEETPAYPSVSGRASAFDMRTVYCEHMKEIIKKEVAAEDYEHPLAGLHIVEDAGNGASGFFAEQILLPLGADISGSVYLEPDGTFPNHVPNPEDRTAMNAARQAVLASGADLGVIFDCDGDRGAVVFSDGTEVNRNTLIGLLAVIVAEKAPGSTVVTDSVTSDELAEFLTKKLNLHHLRYKRGYKNVIDMGVQLNADGEVCELAIETSGHGAFRENHFSDDGAYIAVKIICQMALLRKEGRRIEDLIAELEQPAESEEIRYHIGREDFRLAGENVLNDFRAFCKADPRFHLVVPNFEGIRVSFDDEEVKGWLLLRMSLHDPVLPLNLESKEAGGTAVIRQRIAPFFEQYDWLS